MTDWSQFKSADEPAAEPGVDWSQFKPEAPKPSLFERAKSLFTSSDTPAADIPAADPMGTGFSEIAEAGTSTIPVLDRPATPEQVAARPPGFSAQEMAEGSIAPWKAEANAKIAAYGNTNRSPVLKAPGQSAVGDALRSFDRKPLDNSLFGAVTETAGDAARGLAKVVPSLAKSGYGVLQIGAEIAGADGLSSFARSAQDAGADWLVQFDNPNGDSLVTGAFQSLGTAIAGGSLAGVNGAIGLAVGQTAADKYNELRKGGIGLTDALEGATVHGVAEYLGERIGMPSLGRMVSGLASKTGIPPMAALKEFLKQQGEEQVTLAIQSAYDKLGSGSLRGDMTLDDYLNDVVTTAQQTAIMTAAAAGGGRIARAASTGAQQMLTPGLAARIEPPREPFEAGFAPMTDSANIAPAAPAAPAPVNLFARAAPVRVEDQPTTPMTPEQILSAPAVGEPAPPAARVDVNDANAVLAQLGLGQPAGRVEPFLPAEPNPLNAPVNAPDAAAERFAPIAPAVADAAPTPAPAAEAVAQVDAANDPVFKSKTAAAVTARRAGGKVIEVPGGFAVQQDAGAPATSDRGSATPAPVAPAPVSPQAQAGSPAEGAGSSRPTPADRFQPVQQFDRINVGPGGFIQPKAVAEGRNTYRETDVGGLDQLMREDRQAVPFGGFVSDSPDLAIGQGMNRGVHIVFRPDSVSGREHSKPLTGDAAGREYRADLIAPYAVQTITLSAAEAKKLRGLTRLRLADQFDMEEMSDGRLRYHRKGLKKLSPPDQIVETAAPKKRRARPEPTPEAPRAEAPAQGAAPATEAAADVPAARPAAVEAARPPAQKPPDVAAQVELRKRASVLKSLLDCMA